MPVTVYEASDRVGGVIQSFATEGYLAEFGPNTILETSPRIGQLVQDAGLGPRRLDPDPAGRGALRGALSHGPSRCPVRRWGSSPRKLFTAKAKLAVLREPFVPPRRDGTEESVAEFVVRRLGQEFLDHAIDALVAGVYAGDPYKLSVPQAFPKLGQLEARYGSLIKGQIFGARERKRARRSGQGPRARSSPLTRACRCCPTPCASAWATPCASTPPSPASRRPRTAGRWNCASEAQDTAPSTARVVYAGTAFKLAEIAAPRPAPLNFAAVGRNPLSAGRQRRPGFPPRRRGASLRRVSGC